MNEPLRILHVVVNMNRGGAETLIMNLYRNIDRSKVQFDFLTCKEGVFDSEITKMGGNVHRIPYVTDVGHFGYINALDYFFASHPEYQIVHSHMNKMSGFVLRSAKKVGIPIRIAHSHSTSSEGGMAAKTYKWYAGKFILSCATHLFSCAKKAAEWLYENKAEDSMILKNGIELDRFRFSSKIREEVRHEMELGENTFIVGHIGRFSQPKNHSFLVDVFSELVKVKPDAILVLAGDGLLRQDIEKKVTDLHLVDKVKFLGVRSDIHRLLQAFDVFVFPSLYEGLPVTLIEAQGSGLPCIISEAITQEVDMGIKLIEYSPLFDKQMWIEKIINTTRRKFPRNITSDAFAKKGYDIKNTAKWTQNFYLEVSR